MLKTSLRMLGIAWFLFNYTSTEGQTVLVSGQLNNTGDSKYLYLSKLFGNKTVVIDSTKLSKGSFQFNTPKNFQRGFYRLSTQANVPNVTLILGEPDVKVNGELSEGGKVNIESSRENSAYMLYQKINEEHNKQSSSIQKEAELLRSKQLSEEAFRIELGKLQSRFDSLGTNYSQQVNQLIEENPGLFITKVMGMFNRLDTTQAPYFFSKAEYTDPEFCNGDMLSSKVSMYFQRFVNPDINSWKQASSTLLVQFPAQTASKEVVYLSLIDMFSPYDKDFARDLAERYIKEYPGSMHAKRALANTPKGSLKAGDEVIDLSLPSPEGKTINLKSLRGKVVLLDFWASWCGPCRMENPNVVNAYNKYKDKGFTVYSVSLDENKEKWQAAIAKDGLVWPNHVSDLKGWKSKAAELYNVKGIPMTFLIDRKGIIVATNLRGEALEQKLHELLKE